MTCCISLLQLNEYSSDDVGCFDDPKAELGCGAFGVVLCCVHRILGNIAVKCFAVSGGDADKENIANM